jgi:hypothetical protein
MSVDELLRLLAIPTILVGRNSLSVQGAELTVVSLLRCEQLDIALSTDGRVTIVEVGSSKKSCVRKRVSGSQWVVL